MEIRTKAPFMEQDPHDVAVIVKGLKGNKRQTGFAARSKTYEISDGSGRTVESWNVAEWDYKKANLPTYARGLFTHSNNGKPEIAVRGYDKFFNVGEIRKTEWANIEANTRGPYELSVKENGCIIFIGGLDDNTLLVTSKHSTGPRQGYSANHALAGEAWIDKQLQQIGKTRAELAKTLRSMNATAVAELCDDSFEEHVLPYTAEQAGLYLHGINLNLPEFATYPSNLVGEFADTWGFRRTMYIVKNTIEDVKPFLDKVAETGNYDGRDTEGFVVRCQARDSADGAWHDWFFKYKFEEPYLMYRQWREATRAVIAGKLPKFKKHQKITQEYLEYARRQLHKNPAIGKQFNDNHGIIAMREGFLQEKGVKGSDIIRSELEEGGEGLESVTKNVLLVPVATLGCGKTTVALALVKLFGWGHEQNDNIEGKQRRPQRFALAVTNAMAIHPVTIADRNNHQKRERQQIIEDVKKVVPSVYFVALHWVHERSNYSAIRQVTHERVLSRGDNHQTIQAGSKPAAEITGIMEGFLQRFEPVNEDTPPDDDFDCIISLDPEADSRQNLEQVVRELHETFPKLFEMPSAQQMDEALQTALDSYKAKTVKRDFDDRKQRAGGKADAKPAAAAAKPAGVEYFGVFVPAGSITSLLDSVFSQQTADVARFYNQLKATRRVQKAFHVTLIHRAGARGAEAYWTELQDRWRQAARAAGMDPDTLKQGQEGNIVMGQENVSLESVVWDDRLMAISVVLGTGSAGAGGDGRGGSGAGPAEAQALDNYQTVNEIAHITIGTAGDGIKPVESNALLKRARATPGSKGIKSLVLGGGLVVKGDVKAVLSR